METNGAFLPDGGTTGRSLVLFEEGEAEAGMQAVQEAVGVEVVTATGEEAAPAEGGGFLFESLGVAVVDAPPEQVAQAAGDAAIIAIEPERIVYALEATQYAPPQTNGQATLPQPVAPSLPVSQPGEGGGRSAEYLRGYREAVLHLTDAVASDAATAEAVIAAVDESQATWGLQVTKVVNCCRTAKGIRIAVLDTGFDLQHPDFAGRSITTQSFITGQAVQDGNGHGTHCIGTAMGAKCPGVRPRYGIAYEAEIYAGKVLSNAGSGSDTGILAGIEWAVQNKCAVISMSLGAPTRLGQAFSQVFERAARRAQERGALIVAAAGNDSTAGRHPPGQPPGELPVDHGRGRDGRAGRDRALLEPRDQPGRRAGRHRRAGRRRALELAAADALPPDQRHEHGDSARRGHRRAVRRGRPDGARRGARTAAHRRGAAAVAALLRRRRGDGAGALIEVTVLVAEDHVGAIDDVAAALQDAGLRLGAALPETGVITGSVEDEAAIEPLREVDGVEAVEQAQEFQLPPPDSDVQ
jgi:hypothetical protein